MGLAWSQIYIEGHKPDYLPAGNETPTFDPQFGFKAPRKVRESKYTPEELKVLNIPECRKNYCADKFVDFKICMRKYAPFSIFCQCQRHAINKCLYEDEILRMKEYEREKRLRLRQKKIEEMKAASASA